MLILIFYYNTFVRWLQTQKCPIMHVLAYGQRDAETSSPTNQAAKRRPYVGGYFSFLGIKKGTARICAVPCVRLVRMQYMRFEGYSVLSVLYVAIGWQAYIVPSFIFQFMYNFY